MNSSKLSWPVVALALALYPCASLAAREIVIGQSLGLTGGGADVAKQYLQGAKCHFENVNRDGGVRGSLIRLVSLDDGGQRERTLENTRKLIGEQNAFALFGYTAAAGAQAAFPIVEASGIPLVGIASGGLGVHDKFRKTIFHVRASYTAELDGIVRVLGASGFVQSSGTYAFVYNQDAKANLGAFEDVARRNNVTISTSVAIDRNSTDMAAAAKQVLDSNPSAVIAITTAKAMAALIKELRGKGFGGTIVSSSFAGDPLSAEAGRAGAGTIVVQVVPDPRVKTTGVARAYHAALVQCGAEPAHTVSGLEGYISARVLVEGLRRSGGSNSREALIASLETMGKLDLGGIEVAFSPNNREGTTFVELLIIARDGRLKK
jgi:ABC-type branched-subunit amino acid transport system substrate-binding protein